MNTTLSADTCGTGNARGSCRHGAEQNAGTPLGVEKRELRDDSVKNRHQRNPGKAYAGQRRYLVCARKRSPNPRGGQDHQCRRHSPTVPFDPGCRSLGLHPAEKAQMCAIESNACRETPFLRKGDRKALLLYGPPGTGRRLGLYFHLRETAGAAEMERVLACESAAENLYRNRHGEPCVFLCLDEEEGMTARKRIWTVLEFCKVNKIPIDEFLLMDAVVAGMY